MSFILSKYHFKSDQIFSGVSPKILTELNAIKFNQVYSKGHILYYKNSIPSAVFYLKKGKVKIEQLGQDGKTRIFYVYTDGEYFGFRPLLSSEDNPLIASFL
jgi:CRP-like cAMP-binding protein